MVTFLAESALLRFSSENKNWWFRSGSELIVGRLDRVEGRVITQELEF